MILRRNFLFILASFFCAVLCLGLWYTAVNADGGPGLPLPEGAFAGSCSDWTMVNESAFGVPSTATTYPGGDYFYEDAFEVVVHHGQLYVGMEADDIYGAQIWRSKASVGTVITQADWEEVAHVNGLPFGNGNTAIDRNGEVKLQNDHIDSLASFNGVLYASTANGGYTEQGHLIYSSTTGAPGSWTPVIDAGFGFTENVNFKDMQAFDGWLCAGTQNAKTGAQVWCTRDGGTWVQKSYGGFGAVSDDPATVEVWAGHVYSGALYFGAQRATASPNVYQGVLYRTEDISSAAPLWAPVYTSPVNGYRIDILGDLNNALYISYRDTVNGIVILRSQNGDFGSWEPVNVAGMDNNSHNTSTVLDGATVYNGLLYCAVTNRATGAEVWRTDGISRSGQLQWTQVNPPGFGHSGNRAAQLIAWNGYLYAWTANYVSGQEVRRTSCGVCQAQVIGSPGRYDFPAVGTTLTFTVESLDVVTVCVKPDLMPIYQNGGVVLSRTIEISTDPIMGNFVADIDIVYEPQELNPSAVNSPTLYLRYWTGDAWTTVCAGDHNAPSRTITCRDLTQFSSWAVSGTPGTPTHVNLTVVRTENTRIGLGLALIGLIGVFLWWHRSRICESSPNYKTGI